MRVLLPVLLVLLLAACSGDSDDVAGPSEPGPDPRTRLEVEVEVSPDAAPVRWTLTCDPPGGDHPDPQGACAALARTPDPLAPLPADAVCTEVYGGPQTAVVRGTHDGREVSLELSRTDGCRIAQWDRLVPLVPGGGA